MSTAQIRSLLSTAQQRRFDEAMKSPFISSLAISLVVSDWLVAAGSTAPAPTEREITHDRLAILSTVE